MQPFTDSQEYHKIINHFNRINQTPITINSYQQPLIQKIMDHQKFNFIVNTLQIIQAVTGTPLATVDLSLIQLKTLQIQVHKKQNENYRNKLQKTIDKLYEILNLVQNYKLTANGKLNWLQAENQRILQGKEQIEEEIEIIQSQCLKNQKVVHRNTNGNNKQLQELLMKYQCKNGFPRNKTEVLMLINRIQARIQHLQMKKLANYQINP